MGAQTTILSNWMQGPAERGKESDILNSRERNRQMVNMINWGKKEARVQY